MTDEASVYKIIGRDFASHNIVRHMYKEYVSKVDPSLHPCQSPLQRSCRVYAADTCSRH